MGWASFGGVSHALIAVQPGGGQWVVSSEQPAGGWRLLELDAAHGFARLEKGTNEYRAGVPSAARLAGAEAPDILASRREPGVSPAPCAAVPPTRQAGSPGGQTAGRESGQSPDVAGAGRIAVPLAGVQPPAPGQSGANADPASPGLPPADARSQGTPNGPPSQRETALTPSSDTPDPAELLLRKILGSPPPEIGSLIGTGTDSEMGPVKRILRATEDPVIRLRLLQQLDGYASPPAGAYQRNPGGEWVDLSGNGG